MASLTAKIGQIVVGKAPDELQAVALGSCIGAVIYDANSKIAGLAHVLLPDSTAFSKLGTLGKYADLAIPETIKLIIAKGGKRENLKAKIAGGAKMFQSNFGKESDIGRRNTDAVIAALKRANITLIAQDIGDNIGRTINYNIQTNVLTIKLAQKGLVRQI